MRNPVKPAKAPMHRAPQTHMMDDTHVVMADKGGSEIAAFWYESDDEADEAIATCDRAVLAYNTHERLVKSLDQSTESLREYHRMAKPPVKGRLGRELKEAEAILGIVKAAP